MRKIFLIAFVLLLKHSAWALPDNLIFDDNIYDDDIKTVLLFPANDSREGNIRPAALPISHPFPLILKFDELRKDEASLLNLKIVHCDASWQPSGLSELEYLYDYNEFTIDDYEFSFNTKVPYTHYTFALPKVKIPGNYLLYVYREYDEEALVLSKRFIVYDNKIKIDHGFKVRGGAIQESLQQMEFTVNYSNYPVPNPMKDISVMIRQNGRWDNAITDLRPSLIRDDLGELIYRPFTNETSFLAGNEFRYFDLTSVRYNGMNVDDIKTSERRIDAFLMRDKFRGYEAYGSNRDLNGGYYIDSKRGTDKHLESEYVEVHFFLETPKDIRDNIFVTGALTNWKTDESSKMRYIKSSGIYTGTLLLKQGLYNYQYVVPDYTENPNIVEGNHYETQNQYEIIVYFRHPVLRTDVILGYALFTTG